MTRKEKFIENAIRKHGDKFDYSKVEYVDNVTKVCIVCPVHGEFWQTPASHLNNKGCKKCSIEEASKNKTLTQEMFQQKVKEVHGDKYSIENVVYKDSRSYIYPYCYKHGEFKILANGFLRGGGCKKCANDNNSKNLRMTQEEFLLKARQVHGWKYDYSKVAYKDGKTKICIICPEHGEFWQIPAYHLNGSGCQKCGRILRNKNSTKTIEFFLEKAKEVHGDKYDYSKVEYAGSREKICVICPEHGEFWQRSSAHLDGQGCPKCADNQKITKEEFIKRSIKVHGEKYDYSSVIYEKNYKKVCIICPEHGEFWQTPHTHLNGAGCPRCKRKSRLEDEVRNILKRENIKYEEQKTFEGMKYKSSLKIDFYLPDFNIAIECQGEQHFCPKPFSMKVDGEKMLKENQLRDAIKRKFCENNKIKIVYFNHLPKFDCDYKILHTEKALLNEIRGS